MSQTQRGRRKNRRPPNADVIARLPTPRCTRPLTRPLTRPRRHGAPARAQRGAEVSGAAARLGDAHAVRAAVGVRGARDPVQTGSTQAVPPTILTQIQGSWETSGVALNVPVASAVALAMVASGATPVIARTGRPVREGQRHAAGNIKLGGVKYGRGATKRIGRLRGIHCYGRNPRRSRSSGQRN